MVQDEPQTELPRLLRGRFAAVIFGVSLRTWQMWNAAGRIPRPIRIGRSPLWPLNELMEWVDAGCPPRSEWESRKKS